MPPKHPNRSTLVPSILLRQQISLKAPKQFMWSTYFNSELNLKKQSDIFLSLDPPTKMQSSKQLTSQQIQLSTQGLERGGKFTSIVVSTAFYDLLFACYGIEVDHYLLVLEAFCNSEDSVPVFTTGSHFRLQFPIFFFLPDKELREGLSLHKLIDIDQRDMVLSRNPKKVLMVAGVPGGEGRFEEFGAWTFGEDFSHLSEVGGVFLDGAVGVVDDEDAVIRQDLEFFDVDV